MDDMHSENNSGSFQRYLIVLVVLLLMAVIDGAIIYAAKMFLEPPVAEVKTEAAKSQVQTASSTATGGSTVFTARRTGADPAVTTPATTAPAVASEKPAAPEKPVVQEKPVAPVKPAAEDEKAAKTAPQVKKVKVVGNSDSKRYHLPGMKYYNRVDAHHRVEFGSEEEAVKAGYHKAPR